MLTSYRRILSQPGTLRFSMAGLVARLPISMIGLGIVLLVSAATGSYGVAGAISAAYMFANAAHPGAGTAVAVVACAPGTLAYSAQPWSAPPPHPRASSWGRRRPMPW